MKTIIFNATELIIAPESQCWWGSGWHGHRALRLLLLPVISTLQSSPFTHRVHEAAAGMSPSPSVTPITARRLSEPFGHPIRLTRCDWGSAASAQAVVPFIQPPLVCGEFPSCNRQLVYVRACVCMSECVCMSDIHHAAYRPHADCRMWAVYNLCSGLSLWVFRTGSPQWKR